MRICERILVGLPKSSLLYECETWAVSMLMQKRLEAVEL